MARQWHLALVAVLLSGCSLPPSMLPSFGSGPAVSDERIGPGFVRVPLAPAGGAECGSADECTLVGAAQAARRVGGTHFLVIPGHGGPTQKGYAYIKVFTLAAGDGVPSGAVSVEEALHFYGGRRDEPVAGNAPTGT